MIVNGKEVAYCSICFNWECKCKPQIWKSVDDVLNLLKEKLKEFDLSLCNNEEFRQIAINESNRRSRLLTGRNREVDIEYVEYKVREMFSADRKKITDTIDYLSNLKF